MSFTLQETSPQTNYCHFDGIYDSFVIHQGETDDKNYAVRVCLSLRQRPPNLLPDFQVPRLICMKLFSTEQKK